MLQLPIVSLFLRTLPEGILAIWISYFILNKPIDKRNICISGIILGVSTYLVRMLPIDFGIHIILILMIYIFLLYKINCIDVYRSVTASISTYILLIISEWITVIIYINLLGIDTKTLSDHSLRSILLGLPSLLLLFVMGGSLKFFNKIRKHEED